MAHLRLTLLLTVRWFDSAVGAIPFSASVKPKTVEPSHLTKKEELCNVHSVLENTRRKDSGD